MIALQLIAGSGKTFLALRRAVEVLLSGCTRQSQRRNRVLFVARSQTLAYHFCGWLLMRLQHHHMAHEHILDIFNGEASAIHVLYEATSGPTFPKAIRLHQLPFSAGRSLQYELQEVQLPSHTSRQPWSYNIIIVDEAHHTFSQETRLGKYVLSNWKRTSSGISLPGVASSSQSRSQCQVFSSLQSELVLCYDVSQISTPDLKRMPVADVSIVLDEVVRSFRRVFLSSIPYSFNQRELFSYHNINGPPLTPFIFDKNRTRGSSYANYAKYIWQGIQWLTQQYPDLPLHRNVAILVRSKATLRGVRKSLLGLKESSQVNYVAAVDSVKIVNNCEGPPQDRMELILDNIDAFDGMERLIVFLVDFDQECHHRECLSQTQSAIYRGLTRAHMFVVIVQEFISGGQFAFLRDVSLIPARKLLPGRANGDRALRNLSGEFPLVQTQSQEHTVAPLANIGPVEHSASEDAAMDTEGDVTEAHHATVEVQAVGSTTAAASSRSHLPHHPLPASDTERPHKRLKQLVGMLAVPERAKRQMFQGRDGPMGTRSADGTMSVASSAATPEQTVVKSIQQSLFLENQGSSTAKGSFFDPYSVEIDDEILHTQVQQHINSTVAAEPDCVNICVFLNDQPVKSSTLEQRQAVLEEQLDMHESQRKALGNDDPLLSKSMCSVAAAFGDVGALRLAIRWQNSALAVQQKVLHPTHGDISLSLGRLALWHHSLGNTQKALVLQSDSLARQRQAHPSNLEELATSINNLAAMHTRLHHHRQALTLQREALDLRLQVHPREHVLVATAMSDLANSYRNLGHLPEALHLLQKAVSIHTRVLNRGM